MTTQLTPGEAEKHDIQVKYQSGGSDAVYGIGMIGAWVFYIGRAKSFKEGLVGFFKGLFWPAFVVYDVLMFLNKE